MQSNQFEDLSEQLYRALKDNRPIEPLTAHYPQLTLEQAYALQLRVLARRQEDDGETVIGKKIGVTSDAVMKQLDLFRRFAGGLCGNHDLDFSHVREGVD